MEMLAKGLAPLSLCRIGLPVDPRVAVGLELNEASLRARVHHAGAVAHDTPLEQVHRLFTERQVEFLALVRNGMVTGICSRSRLGILLGARFGFALYSRSPAHVAQVAKPLVFVESTPVRKVLEQALARPSDEFHEDVVLVDANHALIGLVPIDALARLQNELVADQLGQLQRQHDELRAMERQLARQEKQKLLETLVGGIAHELNNKLTPIHGFSELIGLTATEENRHYAALIAKSVAEAATIIRQLLQLSRPHTAPSQLADLRGVVEEALSVLRFQLRDARCRVRTAWHADPVWVRVDPAEIKQVVINLVLNALQAMADRVHATLDIEVRAGDGSATLLVADTGIGIPPENIERIFDPFFTTKSPDRGTGLGLSVCFSIVRRLGGDIAVDSAPEQGARFTVTLPREAAGPMHEEVALAEVEALQAGTPASREARVLVVEDEAPVRRLIRDVLISRFGCEVDTVPNGIEALERLASNRYALVLSDVRMATMNGTELYLWLREAQPLTAERFIFITGYPGEEHLQAEVAEWNIAVLTKPFTMRALCDLCAPYLESSPAEQSA